VYFVQLGVAPTVTRKLSVSLLRFRAPFNSQLILPTETDNAE
jgi:hypothetical protein